jgi:glucose/arabinose dehydrogenase
MPSFRALPRLSCGFAIAAGAACLTGNAAAAEPAAERVQSVKTEAGPIAVEIVAGGLEHPWGIVFLPDGRMLVTERAGRLRLLTPDGALSEPLSGTPDVFAQGQGGLLDVALHPEYPDNQLVYLSFAEPGDGGASTALGRGRLATDRGLEGFEVIWRQRPKVPGPNHFGGRIVFTPEGNLFLTLGERFKFEPAQELDDHLGTIVRLQADGSIPTDNPFVARGDAADAIWSYGHRNIESAGIQPQTGNFWVAEMGPLGGDELNLIEPGLNYGWPVVSWGEHYSGEDIPDPPTRPELAGSVRQWTPVISPSGMAFYQGAMFPSWQGSMLIGSLTDTGIVRLIMDGAQVLGEERIPLGARIRDVAEDADGAVYVLTDQPDGNVWRLRLLGSAPTAPRILQ